MRVVDPVGAGDAFVAAWLAAVLHGADARAALDRAADAGALACTVDGDWRLPVDATVAPDPSRASSGRSDAVGPDPAVHDRVDR